MIEITIDVLLPLCDQAGLETALRQVVRRRVVAKET
jgi:hypothetical protein